MPLEEIKQLLLRLEVDLAPNAVLFLWACNPLLAQALEVIKAWGFQYKTNIAWVKEGGQGTGWYVRSHHELLLIATRGTFKPLTNEAVKSVLHAKRREHSRKPDEIFTLIRKLYPNCNNL